jgi:hypothetical protein
LPVKYKIVAFSKRGIKKINTHESKLMVNSDMTKQDQNLYDFMQMDKEGRDFEDEQTKKGRISHMNTSNDYGVASASGAHNTSGILANRFNPSSTKLTSDVKLRERSLSPQGPRTRGKSRQLKNKNYDSDEDDAPEIYISGVAVDR